MNEVTGVDILVTGPRNYPHAHFKLPAAVVSDLPDLLNGARELNPAVDVQALVRGIWRLGCAALQRNRQKGIPFPADLG